MGVISKYEFSIMSQRVALVLQETQKKSQKNAKTHPECIKIGEIASEGRRRLMDDKKPVNVI